MCFTIYHFLKYTSQFLIHLNLLVTSSTDSILSCLGSADNEGREAVVVVEETLTNEKIMAPSKFFILIRKLFVSYMVPSSFRGLISDLISYFSIPFFVFF